MKRWLTILPLFTLSFIFALDDNVKDQDAIQQEKSMVVGNDVTVPIDINNLQRIRKTDQFKERSLEYNNVRLKKGNSLKKNFRLNGIDGANFSDIKKKMDRKREVDKRKKYNNIPNLQEQINRSFHMPEKSKAFREASLKRKNSLRQKYQVESKSTSTNNIFNRNIPGNLNPGQWNSRDSWWVETFDTDATPGADLAFTSDYTWNWWGWGTAAVSEGNLNLTGAADPFGEYTSWVQIDGTIDPDVEINPTNALIAARVKFSTIATQPHNDYFHFAVAIDPSFLSNLNLYTMYASPSEGVIGSYYWQEAAWDSVSTSEVIYDQYFWQVVAVDGDTVSVWALPDTAEYIPDEPDYMFSINNVTDVVEPLETLLLVGHSSSDSSSVHIDEVYYSTLDDFDDSEFEYVGSFGESDYYLSNFDTTWYEADDMSDNAGGHLVTISSEEENDFIYSLISLVDNSWIGFSDIATEGDWVWTTGEDVVYTNWDVGEPNDSNDGEDCAEMWSGEGEWNDNACDLERHFFMEVDSLLVLDSLLSSEFVYADSLGGSYYYLSTSAVTWHEADDMSENAGGHLVSVNSAEENNIIAWLMDEIIAVDEVWIGFNDVEMEGYWEWTTGERDSSCYDVRTIVNDSLNGWPASFDLFGEDSATQVVTVNEEFVDMISFKAYDDSLYFYIHYADNNPPNVLTGKFIRTESYNFTPVCE